MNKKFLNAILFGALAFSTVTFTACKDYDDDINSLTERVDAVEKTLSDLKTAKQEDLKALLNQAKAYQQAVEDYTDSDIPEMFRTTKTFHPFYRNIKPFLNVPDETYNAIISKIVHIIQSRKIVDFQNDLSVRRNVINDIEDYLFDEVEEKLNADTVEQIAQTAWNLAVQNKDML